MGVELGGDADEAGATFAVLCRHQFSLFGFGGLDESDVDEEGEVLLL